MNRPSLFLASALLPLSGAVVAAPAPHGEAGHPSATAASNRRIVDTAFDDWAAGRKAFYDLLADDAFVTIAGQSPHSGTFSKAAFLRDRARPFQALFLTPIVPDHWTVTAVDDEVIVRWASVATACDSQPYRNSYAYFITMKDGRATALTMFLDMGAFDDVWNRCTDARPSREVAQ